MRQLEAHPKCIPAKKLTCLVSAATTELFVTDSWFHDRRHKLRAN